MIRTGKYNNILYIFDILYTIHLRINYFNQYLPVRYIKYIRNTSENKIFWFEYLFQLIFNGYIYHENKLINKIFMELVEFKELNKRLLNLIKSKPEINDFKSYFEYNKGIETIARKILDFLRYQVVCENLDDFIFTAINKTNNYRYFICNDYEINIFDDYDFGKRLFKVCFKFKQNLSYTLILIR